MNEMDGPEPGNGGATVFVSYSREDRKRALPIIKRLEQAGFKVWWDGLLGGGERFSRTTEAALEGAKAVVVLWSKASVGSHWVHDEATRGRDRRCLVPVSLDGSEPPLGFRQFQVIDCSRSAGKPMEQIVRAVAALHDRPMESVPAARKGPAPSRRAFILGGAAVAIAGGGVAAWQLGMFGGGAGAPNSVAVLPFANMSGDPGQAYFSDGLAAEVRSELARNAGLQVAAQASSNKFRQREEDARSIARALRVSYLLDGNVRRSGNLVRVSAELIDGRTGFSKWTQTFERPMTDIFAVQSEIAQAVFAALSAQVTKPAGPGADGTDRRLGRTQSVAAYDLYLRGKDAFELSADEASDRSALSFFDQAIAADPAYGAAFAGRSRSLAVIANQYAQGKERLDLYGEAVEAAERSVALAPALADAHSALGFALFSGRLDVKAARAPYDRSNALGGGDADVLSRYALYCARTGRFDEARKAIGKAAGLDPLSPRTFRSVGAVEYAARQYAASIPPVERALSLNPKMSGAWAAIGASRLMMGETDKARSAFGRETSSLFGLPGIAIIARRSGDRAGAEAALARMIAEHGDNSLYQQAQVRAQWGEAAAALAALAKARAAGDSGLIFIRNDPLLDPLRQMPDFSHLLSDLGFD
ncbi:MAG TPA: TIR domain-containing protein [Allosphingosinicella sp.]